MTIFFDGLVKSKSVYNYEKSGTQLNEKCRMPPALSNLSAGWRSNPIISIGYWWWDCFPRIRSGVAMTVFLTFYETIKDVRVRDKFSDFLSENLIAFVKGRESLPKLSPHFRALVGFQKHDTQFWKARQGFFPPSQLLGAIPLGGHPALRGRPTLRYFRLRSGPGCQSC